MLSDNSIPTNELLIIIGTRSVLKGVAFKRTSTLLITDHDIEDNFVLIMATGVNALLDKSLKPLKQKRKAIEQHVALNTTTLTYVTKTLRQHVHMAQVTDKDSNYTLHIRNYDNRKHHKYDELNSI